MANQAAIKVVAPIETTGDNRLRTSEKREEDEERSEEKLAELYRAAKDENELLEFKNYELLFKIQELELNQRKIISDISTSSSGRSTSAAATADSSKQHSAATIRWPEEAAESTWSKPLIKFGANDGDEAGAEAEAEQHRHHQEPVGSSERELTRRHDLVQAAVVVSSTKVSFMSHTGIL